MLVLLDIDGTLLHGTPVAHAAALLQAFDAVFGVRLTLADVRAVRPAGRTDREIARLLLRAAGVEDRLIDARMQDWMRESARAYPVHEAAHPPQVAAPDAAPALAALAAAGATLGLLTGNLEPIARAKVRAAGLGDRLAAAPGAFGSDHEDRRALVPLARARAGGGFAGAATVVVGDTPSDIACARAAGARVVAVATGPHPSADLVAADAVAAGLAEAAAIIAGWLG